MSCMDSKKFSEPQIIKIDSSDDKVSIIGKPCIDFQPDDRWQIKDDENSEGSKSTKKELNNSKNSRPQRNKNAKSKGKNSVVNGEARESSSDSESESSEKVENHSKRKRKTPESETMPDCNTKKKVRVDECNEVNNKKSDCSENEDSKDSPKELADVSKDSPKELADDSKDSPKELADEVLKDSPKELADDSKDSPKELADDSKDSSKELADDSNDKMTMPNLSPANAECSEPKDTKENAEDSILIESDSEKNDSKKENEEENDCEMIPTLEEEKKTEKNGSKISNSNINGTNKNDADIEIININDDKKYDSEDSDCEIQIINPDEDIVKKVSTEFLSTNIQDADYKLTAGFPYYNSLKEKLKNFKAGDFKPVKFPHTGTLLLGENEVIIESPSLLVPLLIKESDQFPKLEGEEKKTNGDNSTVVTRPNISKRNFFQSSVGQFLINLGNSRVQEWYHKDIKRSKLKQLKSAGGKDAELKKTVEFHDKKSDELKEINAPFNFRMHRCKFCEFKTESLIVMEGHYLMPHISPRREYKCNYCDFTSKDPEKIVQHYDKSHKKKAILDSYIPFHECIFCTFQSHLKNKVNAHMNRCRKHFIPSQNLTPPFDFEFPGVTTKPVTINDVIGHRRLILSSAKNPRMPMSDDNNPSLYARKKLASVLTKISGPNAYADMKNPNLMKQLMTSQSQLSLTGSNLQLPPGLVITRPRGQVTSVRAAVQRFAGPRGMPTLRAIPPRRGAPYTTNLTNAASQLASSGISITPVSRPNSGTARANTIPGTKNVTLTPISTASNRTVSQKPGPPQPVALFTNMAGSGNVLGQPQARLPGSMHLRQLRPTAPHQRLNTPPSQVVKGSSGNTFVVCEICDSYIKDLEELRTHMNWVHKVKIHPKMLVSRPPLNCQKCHWRFFTDQGLERHLLGAHGLVTTNMQEMANKNQDGGRCIICGAVFTYKLVSHMTQVHKVTLKPAHLSYKCTVCTATFTLYRLFESHVYNVHSGSAKRSAEDTSSPSEPAPKKVAVAVTGPRKCKDCGVVTENMHDHLIKKHIKKCAVKLCHIEKCEKCLNSSDEMLVIRMSDFGLDDELEDSDENSSEEESSDDKDSDEDSSVKPNTEEKESKTGDLSKDESAPVEKEEKDPVAS